MAAPPPEEIESVAQHHARSVLDNFVKQLLFGTSETAKIAAATSILDRVFGKPAAASGGDAVLPFFGAATSKPVASEIREEARKYAILAVEVLAKITTNGASETARVAAGRALWDRGLGTVAPARVPDEFGFRPVGKKLEAERAAKTAGEGTAWGDDLRPPSTAGQRIN
jgi:hypothetical protein